MAKPNFIELGRGKSLIQIPILYEDRAVMAIDKPAGWLLVPFSWQNTSRNLQAALTSSIAAGDFWARSRSLKFLRNVHRLDGDTSGILLMAKSVGALESLSELFEGRRMQKIYLTVVHGKPKAESWSCLHKLAPNPSHVGQMKVDERDGKEAETHFRVLAVRDDAKLGSLALIEARPVTGRTHQIRVHLLSAGHAVVGDKLYGRVGQEKDALLALRAVSLGYQCPFTKRRVEIRAPTEEFAKQFGFA